jgi:hypothetical protein
MLSNYTVVLRRVVGITNVQYIKIHVISAVTSLYMSSIEDYTK